MPIYEYQCQSCQKTFEYMQRMSEDAKTECEECKGALERLISNTSFSLKGGGWYKDLYASTKKDAKGAGDSSTAAAPSSGTGASSSSDAGSSKPSSDSSSSAASSTPAASAPAASVSASSTSSGSKSSD